MNELKTGGAGSDGTIHDIKDYEVVSDKKIIDSKTFIPMQLKTLQEEEKAIIIGGIVMTCGNTFDENGKEMSARLGDYICYVVEQERQKSYTLGIMKGVELVEGVVEKEASAKHDNHEDWQDGDCDCDGVFDYWEIRRLTDKLKQELK